MRILFSKGFSLLAEDTRENTDKEIAVNPSQVYSFLMKTDTPWSPGMGVK